jgi:hypothetical protein
MVRISHPAGAHSVSSMMLYDHHVSCTLVIKHVSVYSPGACLGDFAFIGAPIGSDHQLLSLITMVSCMLNCTT